MEKRILISGSGGQGIMLMGQMMGLTTQGAGLNVSVYPNYGPQQRGGTSNSRVVISDKDIYAPIPNVLDIFVVMNQEAFDMYASKIKPQGVLLINSSQVSLDFHQAGLTVAAIPVDDLSIELGNIKFANMMMLGALVNMIDVLQLDGLITVMAEKMKNKQDFIEANKAAIKKGASFTARLT